MSNSFYSNLIERYLNKYKYIFPPEMCVLE